MKKTLCGVLLIFSLIAGGCATTSAEMTPKVVTYNGNEIEMLNDVRNAVVGIRADYSDGYAVGSGVAVGNGKYILTNNHVVEGASDLVLYFADESTAGADLIWADAGLDVAVLKSAKAIPYLNFGNSEDVNVGQEVYAVGTPLTLQFKHTFTKGIVSAKDRVVETSSDYGDSFMQSLIQHDASINPGNSGGPLISSQGEIVGINTLKASQGEGLGFAIPVEIGEKIVERLQQNEKYKTPYLGVFGFDSEIAKVYGYNLADKGVFVVSSSGPSVDVLQKGDLIVSFGGKRISKLLDLRLALFDFDVGDEVEIVIIRNGQKKTQTVYLSNR
ncbi:MAG: trypsin-like serine protease [Clostridiales bacterium]|nr:trypsin-like serine protease [Clostridiales bacterium]